MTLHKQQFSEKETAGPTHRAHKVTGWLIGGFAALAALFWWTMTDRLDLPKQMIMLIGAMSIALYAWISLKDFSPSALVPALIWAPVLAWLVAREGMGARVEGWAGWIAAIAFAVVGGKADIRTLSKCLTAAGGCIAVIAWIQAFGPRFLNHELVGFSGRRVVSTLGGPGHLGWWTAAVLPWILLQVRETADSLSEEKSVRIVASAGLPVIVLTLVTGAWVLSGTRTAWAGGIGGVALFAWKANSKRMFHILAFSGIAIGVLSAITVDGFSGKSRLGSRIRDMGETSGTARGRVYLWKVHLSSLGEIPLLGGGPEAFQRLWPRNQERYLRKNPGDEHFRTDLRHAHADPVEIFYDFGIFGLILGIWVLVRLFKPPDTKHLQLKNGRYAATASAVSLLVCGLGAPVLFFAPTLLLGAIALGVSLGPEWGSNRLKTVNEESSAGKAEEKSLSVKKFRMHRSLCMALIVLGLVLASTRLAVRLVSEIQRSRSTMARQENNTEEAARLAKKSLQTDPRNPRGWMELGLAMENMGRFREALDAWKSAVRDLPTDEVQDRIVNLIGADFSGGRSLPKQP